MGIVSYALLCADRVITENNGKKGLIGVFSGFQFPAFPSPPTHWFIYAGLANLHGKQDFALNLVHEESQHVLFSVGGEISATTGHQEVELVVPVANLVFQRAGSYVLTLNVGGIPAASRVLRVVAGPPAQSSN